MVGWDGTIIGSADPKFVERKGIAMKRFVVLLPALLTAVCSVFAGSTVATRCRWHRTVRIQMATKEDEIPTPLR